MLCKNVMSIVGKCRELSDVRPHVSIAGVKQVRAVFVNFDSGRRVDLAVRVAAYVGALFDNEDTKAEVFRRLLRNRKAVESGAHDDKLRLFEHVGPAKLQSKRDDS
jgi:hypothetical protein